MYNFLFRNHAGSITPTPLLTMPTGFVAGASLASAMKIYHLSSDSHSTPKASGVTQRFNSPAYRYLLQKLPRMSNLKRIGERVELHQQQSSKERNIVLLLLSWRKLVSVNKSSLSMISKLLAMTFGLCFLPRSWTHAASMQRIVLKKVDF